MSAISNLPETVFYNDEIYYLIVVREQRLWTISYVLIVDTDEDEIIMRYPPAYSFSSYSIKSCVDECLEVLKPHKNNNLDFAPNRTT